MRAFRLLTSVALTAIALLRGKDGERPKSSSLPFLRWGLEYEGGKGRMTTGCQDCGEEPALPGKKVCGYCSDYADYRASVARQNQQAQLAALDRELGPGG